jgi:hypothetical protein
MKDLLASLAERRATLVVPSVNIPARRTALFTWALAIGI